MKLLKMSFLDFISKYFAILDNAFNCLAAFLQHLLFMLPESLSVVNDQTQNFHATFRID